MQPLLWLVMVSLAALWGSYGVVPSAVIGHSQGEIAAACAAGALSLDDGARVVALRSKLIAAELAGLGGMASVQLPAAAVTERLRPWPGRLQQAAVNGPTATVVCGEATALSELLDALAAEGTRARRIAVDYASHSHYVEAIREPLLDALATVGPRSSGVAFYSTVNGDVLDTAELDGGYWYRNLRQTVEFHAATRAAPVPAAVFAEISAHPTLTLAIEETAEDVAAVARAVPALKRDHGGLERVATSLAELYVRGVPARLVPVLRRPLREARRPAELRLPAQALLEDPRVRRARPDWSRPGIFRAPDHHDRDRAGPGRGSHVHREGVQACAILAGRPPGIRLPGAAGQPWRNWSWQPGIRVGCGNAR